MSDEQRMILSKFLNNEPDDIMELSALIPNINELIIELESRQKSENDMLYSISNAMLKAGKTLGEKSAGWKHADVVIAILNNPKEFISFSENLISLLHKYGKTIKKPFEVVRSELNAQFILK